MRSQTDQYNDKTLLFLLLSSIAASGFLRYLWSLSLANGDELFFSNGAGSFSTPSRAWSEWRSFFSWLWWEHTGRTADWLSGMFYFFGVSSGKWIASLCASLSAALIVWSLYRLHRVFRPHRQPHAVFVPLGVFALIFVYAFDTLVALVNLTMYSAAVANYLVPSALICLVITLIVENRSASSVYAAAFLACLTATMHEQAAAVLAVLAVIYMLKSARLHPLHTRLFVTGLTSLGVLEMFLAPGLHHKLGRVAANASEPPSPLWQKVRNSLFSFGFYFPTLVFLLTAAVIVLVIVAVRKKERVQAHVALGVLSVVCTAAWFLMFQYYVASPADSLKWILTLALALTLSTWIVIPLMSRTPWMAAGAIFIVCAASSIAIPAAAGLGAVRVFNYPVIFAICFLLWTLMGIESRQISILTPRSFRREILLARLLATVLIVLTALTMVHSVIAFRANYTPGVALLQQQRQQCDQQICPAIDPVLPYPDALSGYGDHDYAGVEAVLNWIEQQ